MILKDFSKEVKLIEEKRMAKGLSLREVGRMALVSHETVRHVERDPMECKLVNVLKVVEAVYDFRKR